MALGRALGAAFLTCVCVSGAAGAECAAWMWGQEVSSTATKTITLTVPSGTMLQVAVDQEVKIKKAGQPIGGFLVAPVYAFDREVVPAGSQVTGRISAIEGVSGKKRFLAALNADFSPARKVQERHEHADRRGQRAGER